MTDLIIVLIIIAIFFPIIPFLRYAIIFWLLYMVNNSIENNIIHTKQIEIQQEQTNELLKKLIPNEKKSLRQLSLFDEGLLEESSSEEDAKYSLIKKMQANRY